MKLALVYVSHVLIPLKILKLDFSKNAFPLSMLYYKSPFANESMINYTEEEEIAAQNDLTTTSSPENNEKNYHLYSKFFCCIQVRTNNSYTV